MKLNPLDVRQRLSYIVGAARDYKSEYIDNGQDEFYRLVNEEVEGPVWEWLERDILPIANVSEELAHTVIRQSVMNNSSRAGVNSPESREDIEDYKSQAYFDHGIGYAKFIFEISHHADVLHKMFSDVFGKDILSEIDKLVLRNEVSDEDLRKLNILLNEDELKLLKLALYSAFLGKLRAKSKELEDKLFWLQMSWDMSLEKQALSMAGKYV